MRVIISLQRTQTSRCTCWYEATAMSATTYVLRSMLAPFAACWAATRDEALWLEQSRRSDKMMVPFFFPARRGWNMVGLERGAVITGVAWCLSRSIMLCRRCFQQRATVFLHTTIMQVVLHSIHLLFPSTTNFFSISTCFSCAFTLCL
jgi:hypothetical protein